jgi:hypothetical protein
MEKALISAFSSAGITPLELAPLYKMYWLPDFIGPVPSVTLDKNFYEVVSCKV